MHQGRFWERITSENKLTDFGYLAELEHFIHLANLFSQE